jgi:hypothetical protein
MTPARARQVIKQSNSQVGQCAPILYRSVMTTDELLYVDRIWWDMPKPYTFEDALRLIASGSGK